MPNTITEDELLEKARELGLDTIAAASRWARDNGLTLVPNPTSDGGGELPPVAQGGLSAVSGEDEEGDAEMGADTEMGGLDYANLDITKLNDPKVFQQLYRDQMAAQQRQEQASARLYEEGRKRILEKYAGPSEAERLYALSRAMLSPTDFPGFKGFLGNVVGALSENAAAQRKAELAREEALANYDVQRQQQMIKADAQRPKTALDIARLYATYSKPTTKSTASPITVGPDLKTRSRRTGMVIKEPPQAAIYELQAYIQDPNNSPENKAIARRNFDRNFGYGASEIFAGEE